MKRIIVFISILSVLTSCSNEETDMIAIDNPEIALNIPSDFPEVNSFVSLNKPTKYGVELGERLFSDKRFSADNTISCASCHIQANAFADHNPQAIGIEGRVGLRNAPSLQNLMFLKFYNWDGSKLQLETQPLVPIITHEEMDSSILEVIGKIKDDGDYKVLFRKTFGDEDITPERIYKSIAQFEYTLISSNSKYDKVKRNEGETFTESELDGYKTFQQKCASCHSSELFTDQSFRNIGFPQNTNTNEAGRGRVTGIATDFMSFRVPTLRNIEYTAPYGSFGQFSDLKSVLDYFDNGVLDAENLDPIFKNNGKRIPLSEQEKMNLIAFMKTLSDKQFVGK
ncbi:cytochrome c peroxidase [Flavobacterium nitrogenifigens]|uniref:Cytochrome c peroxidase n=2 Tax=Flavobacterium TaxID=237 RepID=A0A7W7N8P6_9FLAO|nr:MULTISPECIES: cytochrome c peroxidase [Flavobacterium]MBB4802669.1 cytochrome c peroxidase [Flavobacterium nitrogenifigens]MBB6387627.1 cytochrome c peroxidase [Flavobacterium notoginsengisoli]